jgi:acetyltransferase-like isoleucine patch superfamily enzyme
MGVGYLTGDWDYSTLPPNVQLGRDCFLERKDSFELYRSTREVGLRLGDRVSAYTWTTFNVEAGGCVEVGDDSVLVGAVFMCAEQITLGQRVVVSYGVTIADSDFHPHDPELRREDARANAPSGDKSRRPAIVSRPVVIEDDAWIGVGAIILKGVRIGAGARIGPGAVVTSDVPAGATVAGNPAQVVHDA